jgi:hypothetical protein
MKSAGSWRVLNNWNGGTQRSFLILKNFQKRAQTLLMKSNDQPIMVLIS